MSVSVLNTDAGLSGKTIQNLEDNQTISGLKTFSRNPNPPFAVASGSANVANLDADKLDGDDWTSGVTQLATAVGSASTPPHSFAGDTDTGMYEDGANGLGFATGGTKALGIDSTQFIDSPTQPRCVVHNSGAQSVPDTTETVLTFDTEDVDVGGCHSTSANTGRLTVPTGGDGFYMFRAAIRCNANGTGTRQMQIRKNGDTELRQVTSPGNSTIDSCFEISWSGNLVAGDYLEVTLQQTSGGSLVTGSSTRMLANEAMFVKLW